jgi:hypothetical protein
MLPFFKTWSAKMLTHMRFSLKPLQLGRNQEVYREGDDANLVYLI